MYYCFLKFCCHIISILFTFEHTHSNTKDARKANSWKPNLTSPYPQHHGLFSEILKIQYPDNFDT